jgi:hypothetical protein
MCPTDVFGVGRKAELLFKSVGMQPVSKGVFKIICTVMEFSGGGKSKHAYVITQVEIKQG